MIDCMLFIWCFIIVHNIQPAKPYKSYFARCSGCSTKTVRSKIEIMVDSTGHYSVNGQALSTKDIADLSTAIKQAAQDRRDLMFYYCS